MGSDEEAEIGVRGYINDALDKTEGEQRAMQAG